MWVVVFFFFFFCVIRQVWVTLRWLHKIYFRKERCTSYGNWGLEVVLLQEWKQSRRYWNENACYQLENSGPSIWLEQKMWEGEEANTEAEVGWESPVKDPEYHRKAFGFYAEDSGKPLWLSSVRRICSVCTTCSVCTSLVILSIL